MSDGHNDVEQDKALSDRLSQLAGIEERLITDSDFCANLRLDDATRLLSSWAEYASMRRGYNLSPRTELAHLHILAIGDYIEGNIDSGKLWAVLTGNLPSYMRTGEDKQRALSHISRYAQR